MMEISLIVGRADRNFENIAMTCASLPKRRYPVDVMFIQRQEQRKQMDGGTRVVSWSLRCA